ncbi:Asp-tRNA(Asn)/Glu-tRNA(Gln) amidotransferase A subunit family amidase [Embleya sp. AB8]
MWGTGGFGRGVLWGIPFAVKDLGCDVAGPASTQGPRLFADAVAERDGTPAARYRRAGLVIVGKTNTPEFGKNAGGGSGVGGGSGLGGGRAAGGGSVAGG